MKKMFFLTLFSVAVLFSVKGQLCFNQNNMGLKSFNNYHFNQSTGLLTPNSADNTLFKKGRGGDVSNVVKWNYLSVILKTVNLGYERVLNEKMSLQLKGFYCSAKWLDMSYKGIGVYPEFRYYLSDNDAPAGFFLGPFLGYNSLTLSTESVDLYTGEEIGIEAVLTGIGGGLLIGYQWIFSDIVSLEFFLGPSFGSGSVKVKTEGFDEDDFVIKGGFDGFGLRWGTTLGFAF